MDAKQLFPEIEAYCTELTGRFDQIPEARQTVLNQIAGYVRTRLKDTGSAQLVYVCTHNSRRSHFGQIGASVAAAYYGIEGVSAFSCGTEVTAFHPNAISALSEKGFRIAATSGEENPVYQVQFGEMRSVSCYSKKIGDSGLPVSGFLAVMTCSDADTNCPFIPGTDLRIATTYDDPKQFDGTPLQATGYSERSDQITLECLFVFAQVKSAFTL